MAEDFLLREWDDPSALGGYLRSALPGQYLVLAGLLVYDCPIDCIVVGPQGLFVLHSRDWAGEVHPVTGKDWWTILPSGENAHFPDPGYNAREAGQALDRFLRDEFPELGLAIRQCVVLTNAEAKLMNPDGSDPPAFNQDQVADMITSTHSTRGMTPLDDDARETLARALQERQLTANQRAHQPFVFRSGGSFGSGKRVWTVRAAVKHMDRHPDDGIYHLRNGTLERWFREQGAIHLAGLAREVMQQRETDPRVPLEKFLISTGLVQRPRLSVRPRKLNLGWVLSGDSCADVLRVKKGRGRGYLYGAVRETESWLHIEPQELEDGALEARLVADASALPISATPWRAQILVDTCATEEPVAVPARVRVVGMPSRLNRRLWRPLLGAMIAWALGAVIGWSIGQWATEPPGWFAELDTPAYAWQGSLAFLVGLFWAIFGWFRGWKQPPAWPTLYALGRWLLQTVLWGAALALVAAAGHWIWQQTGAGAQSGVSGSGLGMAVLLGLAAAIVPVVWTEVRSAERIDGMPRRSALRAFRRPLVFTALAIVVAMVAVAAFQMADVIRTDWGLDDAPAAAGEWTVEQWTELETVVNDIVDKAFIEYLDPRAPPLPTATPEGTATVEPDATSGAGTP